MPASNDDLAAQGHDIYRLSRKNELPLTLIPTLVRLENVKEHMLLYRYILPSKTYWLISSYAIQECRIRREDSPKLIYRLVLIEEAIFH